MPEAQLERHDLDGVFVHPMAIVESADIGSGTRVWAFAHVLPGAVIGRDVVVIVPLGKADRFVDGGEGREVDH